MGFACPGSWITTNDVPARLAASITLESEHDHFATVDMRRIWPPTAQRPIGKGLHQIDVFGRLLNGESQSLIELYQRLHEPGPQLIVLVKPAPEDEDLAQLLSFA